MHLLLATYIAAALAALLLPGGFGVPLVGIGIDSAILAAIAVVLLYRAVLVRAELPALRGVLAPFIFLFTYSLVSWAVAGGVIKYDGYDSAEALRSLIAGLLVQFLVFAAFCLGPRSHREAFRLLKLVLACSALSNLITVLAAFDAVPWEVVAYRDDGRSEGLMGQANQHGIFAAVFLPGLLMQAVSERAVMRVIWSVGALATLAAMFIVASRGAFVGLVVGCIAGMGLLRREISLRKVAGPAVAVGVITIVTVVLLSLQFGDFFRERFIQDSSGADISDISAGRIDFWLDALTRMMKTPIALVTGFGWQVYWSLPHVRSPHNTYLNLWFNLGIPGLLGFILIFYRSIGVVRASLDSSAGRLRLHQMAFVVGVLSLLAWQFVGQLYAPWPFIWCYFGLILNLSVTSTTLESDENNARFSRAQAARDLHAKSTDRFGWSAGTGGRSHREVIR